MTNIKQTRHIYEWKQKWMNEIDIATVDKNQQVDHIANC